MLSKLYFYMNISAICFKVNGNQPNFTYPKYKMPRFVETLRTVGSLETFRFVI